MSAYIVFDSDGYCIEKHHDTDVIIAQNTSVEVDSILIYPGFDWKYDGVTISAMNSDESRLRRRKLKNQSLQNAEVAYGNFLNLLGLPIDASSEELMGKLIMMKMTGQTIVYNGITLSPEDISSVIYALMHDIEVNGGSYSDL